MVWMVWMVSENGRGEAENRFAPSRLAGRNYFVIVPTESVEESALFFQEGPTAWTS